jgi:hypothetical protein
MTRAEIEALEGRALDAAVARGVFGFAGIYYVNPDLPETLVYTSVTDGIRHAMPRYHSEWAAMEYVIGEMKRRYRADYVIEGTCDGWCRAKFLIPHATWTNGAYVCVPTAVCRAALLALVR